MKKTSILLYSLLFIISSCVSPKIHNALSKDHKKISSELNESEKKSLRLSNQIHELNFLKESLKKQLHNLKNDSIQNGKALVSLQNKFNELNIAYDLFASEKSREISEKVTETKRLLEQLQESQNSLIIKEDELNALSVSLTDKENELNNLQKDLTARSNRVAELEQIINKKDSTLTNLKNRVSKALIGLEGDGLTIKQENGKIYISLEEDLLFASGKYNINEKGEEALSKLANVLANQNNIEIVIEGHTDNIPINNNNLISDNWDLSVMRSTAVVRIMLKNKKLDPLQLTAAGKGEYNPIANNETAEGRKMNRRIEMIVSPNLDDLFRILEE